MVFIKIQKYPLAAFTLQATGCFLKTLFYAENKYIFRFAPLSSSTSFITSVPPAGVFTYSG